MKKAFRVTALLAIVAFTTMAVSCPNSAPKTVKHKLAIYTADGDTALTAITDAVGTLQGAGKLTPAAAKNVYQINLRVALAIDVLRGRAKTGYNKAEALTIIKQTIDDIRAAEAAGVVNLEGKARTQFLQITFWAQFTATSIQAVIEATKEPSPTPTDTADASFTIAAQPRAEEETVWSDLVLIAQQALIEGIQHSRLNEADAFAAGDSLSAKLKDSLNAKIAAIP